MSKKSQSFSHGRLFLIINKQLKPVFSISNHNNINSLSCYEQQLFIFFAKKGWIV